MYKKSEKLTLNIVILMQTGHINIYASRKMVLLNALIVTKLSAARKNIMSRHYKTHAKKYDNVIGKAARLVLVQQLPSMPVYKSTPNFGEKYWNSMHVRCISRVRILNR